MESSRRTRHRAAAAGLLELIDRPLASPPGSEGGVTDILVTRSGADRVDAGGGLSTAPALFSLIEVEEDEAECETEDPVLSAGARVAAPPVGVALVAAPGTTSVMFSAAAIPSCSRREFSPRCVGRLALPFSSGCQCVRFPHAANHANMLLPVELY